MPAMDPEELKEKINRRSVESYQGRTWVDESKRLAEEHTEYIKGILEAHDEPEDVQRMILHHYRTAFIHGFKHGVELIVERHSNSNFNDLQRLMDKTPEE